mmetsp:Transcript_6659/g.12804  ORF Transcript_6659/g.12804 Transcript_6659/m.12804 type:complete len:97 (-) Transcript_6659:1930-2220(-)
MASSNWRCIRWMKLNRWSLCWRNWGADMRPSTVWIDHTTESLRVPSLRYYKNSFTLSTAMMVGTHYVLDVVDAWSFVLNIIGDIMADAGGEIPPAA